VAPTGYDTKPVQCGHLCEAQWRCPRLARLQLKVPTPARGHASWKAAASPCAFKRLPVVPADSCFGSPPADQAGGGRHAAHLGLRAGAAGSPGLWLALAR